MELIFSADLINLSMKLVFILPVVKIIFELVLFETLKRNFMNDVYSISKSTKFIAFLNDFM